MTYENLDRKLVNALLGDGRASLRSLAEDLDVSVTTVSNHLSDLEEAGIIDGYTPRVDYNALGYDVTAILQLKVEGSDLTEKEVDELAAQIDRAATEQATDDLDEEGETVNR